MRTNTKPALEKQEKKISQYSEIVGKNLQRLLDREGVSQSELARKMNTQPGVICEICSGKRLAYGKKLDEIRVILGVEYYEFFMPTIKPE